MHHIPAFYGKKMQQNKQLNYHIKRFAQTQPSNTINHKRKYEKNDFFWILGWMVYGSDVFRATFPLCIDRHTHPSPIWLICLTWLTVKMGM